MNSVPVQQASVLHVFLVLLRRRASVWCGGPGRIRLRGWVEFHARLAISISRLFKQDRVAGFRLRPGAHADRAVRLFFDRRRALFRLRRRIIYCLFRFFPVANRSSASRNVRRLSARFACHELV